MDQTVAASSTNPQPPAKTAGWTMIPLSILSELFWTFIVLYMKPKIETQPTQLVLGPSGRRRKNLRLGLFGHTQGFERTMILSENCIVMILQGNIVAGGVMATRDMSISTLDDPCGITYSVHDQI